MLKGVNRNVIVVHSGEDSRFEAVYFVLKKQNDVHGSDILKEAGKIVSESGASCDASSYAKKGRPMFLGMLIGILLSSALWLFVIMAAF